MKIDVSIGEVVDKATILKIKLDKIQSPEKLKNIRHEYDLIDACLAQIGISESSDAFKKLLKINLALWDIEDQIRIKEKDKAFDDEFIALARSVYRENDKRAAIKKEINLAYGSDLIEEKEYVNYT